MKHSFFQIGPLSLVGVACVGLHAAPVFEVRDLGAGEPVGLNNAGQFAIGVSNKTYLAKVDGRTYLADGTPKAISETGQVVIQTGTTNLAVYSGGNLISLAWPTYDFPLDQEVNLTPYVSVTKCAIRAGESPNAFVVVGTYRIGEGAGSASATVCVHTNTTAPALLLPELWDNCGLGGVNRNGMIVGMSYADHFPFGIPQRPTILAPDGPRVIQLAPDQGDSAFTAVNDVGHMIGFWRPELGVYQGFYYDGSSAAALGFIPQALNNLDQIVGGTNLWDKGVTTDLSIFVPGDQTWVLERAVGINDAGQILVAGKLSASDTATHTFLLTPTTPLAPSVKDQPVSVIVDEGGEATFTVTVLGSAPFTYAWQHDGQPIDGATNATLTLKNVQYVDRGAYRVVVSNSAGNATSDAATLTVRGLVNLNIATFAGVYIDGPVPATYRIDYTTEQMAGWVTLTNVQLTASPQLWLDLESGTNRARLYRAFKLP